MLINRRNALMAGKRLPYDAEVEFLESTGTQYIDTGIRGAGEGYLEVRFCPLVQSPSSTYWRYFGASNGGTDRDRTIAVNVNGETLFHYGYGGRFIGRMGDVLTIPKTQYKVPSGSIIGDLDFMIFTYNGLTNAGNSRFYFFRLWDSNNNLVRDFIPVRKGSVGYLYDRVSGRLFGNEGTGDFVLGPDVVPVEYLQANNNYYAIGSTIGAVIDTGIVANLGTDVWACDAQFVSFGDSAGCWGRAGDRFAFGRGSVSWYDWYYGFGDTNNRTSKAYDNNRHLFVLDGPNRRLTIDGVSYSGSGAAVAGSLTLAIFNRNNAYGISYCLDNSESRCYSAKLYRSGVLIQDLIPVRVGTDATSWEGAMMDVLTRRIYRNRGTGAFLYGNDLKYPIPAE